MVPMTMKFALSLLVVAATQLIGCSNGAAQGLCKTNVTVADYTKVTPDVMTDYIWEFAICTLRHYRSNCLNNEFHQRVSEDDFVSQSFLGNRVYTTDDLKLKSDGQPYAHCVNPMNLVGLWPYEEPTKYTFELVEDEWVNPDTGELESFQRPQWVTCCERTTNLLQGPQGIDSVQLNQCSPSYCDHQGGGRHNRLLKQIEEFGISSLDEQALQNFDDKCGDYEVSCCCSFYSKSISNNHIAAIPHNLLLSLLV